MRHTKNTKWFTMSYWLTDRNGNQSRKSVAYGGRTVRHVGHRPGRRFLPFPGFAIRMSSWRLFGGRSRHKISLSLSLCIYGRCLRCIALRPSDALTFAAEPWRTLSGGRRNGRRDGQDCESRQTGTVWSDSTSDGAAWNWEPDGFNGTIGIFIFSFSHDILKRSWRKTEVTVKKKRKRLTIINALSRTW